MSNRLIQLERIFIEPPHRPLGHRKSRNVSFGLLRGTFALFFWVMHFWIYRLYNGRLKDRQREIDNIAAENRAYRERFLALIDQSLGLKPNSTYKEPVEPKSEGEKLQIPPQSNAAKRESD